MYFQDLIFTLQKFWTDNGCILLQPYDLEVGAGTSSPATMLRALTDNPWNVAYVQPCRRPSDSRYAENPNRMQHYYQFQVILKPSPKNIQQLCIDSFAKLGLTAANNDFRFVEDDWENPTLGAWGLGWEMWCNGMEVLQFTFMQQIGGIECNPIPGELTYGLERLAMFLQNVDSVWDLKWNSSGVTYGDVFKQTEIEYSTYNLEAANVEILKSNFKNAEAEAGNLLQLNLIQPAYDQCLKASHFFNLLEARGALSVTERASFIEKVRNLSRECAKLWVQKNKKRDGE